jgi:hypothetical protein
MLISLHEHFPIRVTDWLVSAMLFSWGFALFAVDPHVWMLPTFSGLRFIASQGTWAAIATLLGVIRLVALFVNGAVRRSPHLRGFCAFVSIFIWVQLSLGVLVSDYVGPGVAIFPWLALADVLNVYRAAKDAHTSDHTAEQRRRSAARSVPDHP